MKKLFFVFMLGMFLFSCNKSILPTPQVSYCDGLEKPTKFCQIAKRHDTTPEAVRDRIFLGGSLARMGKLYTKDEAIAAMDALIAVLDKSVSYAFFRKMAYDTLQEYPEIYEIGHLYMDHFKSTLIMARLDREWLKESLMHRKLFLEGF